MKNVLASAARLALGPSLGLLALACSPTATPRDDGGARVSPDGGRSDAGAPGIDAARDSAPEPRVDAGPPVPACEPESCASLGQTCGTADVGCADSSECGVGARVEHRALEWGTTQYVRWRFGDRAPATRVEHTVCFDEVPSVEEGFGLGEYIQLFDGFAGDDYFYYGFQDVVQDVPSPGPGVIFSKFGDRDARNVRAGPDSVAVNHDHEGGFVGVRRLFEWGRGCYTGRLERRETERGGDWIDLTIVHEGVERYVGGIWFERTTAEPIAFPYEGSTWTEFYGYFGRNSRELPRYAMRIAASGDGRPPDRLVALYHRLGAPNSSTELLPSTGEVGIFFGGETPRCVPGVLEGDYFAQTWEVPRFPVR